MLESAEFIAGHCECITIDEEAIDKSAIWLAGQHESGAFSLKRWRAENPLHHQDQSDDCLQWVFLVDSLNFCFWSAEPSGELFTVAHGGKLYTGYWSLCAAINRALEEGVPLLDAGFLRDISLECVQHVFRSATDTQVPLLEERRRVLQQMGAGLEEHFGGHFKHLVEAAQGSAERLVALVAGHFPSFADTAAYQGRTVYLYKRAQILVADVWAAFEGESHGRFDDIDQITMFADYRVPQVLAHLGILRYSDPLLAVLRSGELLPSGSPTEVEIRACSIWSVELLRRKLVQLLQPILSSSSSVVNAITIDFYLWDYAKDHADLMNEIPIHRTRSIYY